jgi:hypothetical protein
MSDAGFTIRPPTAGPVMVVVELDRPSAGLHRVLGVVGRKQVELRSMVFHGRMLAMHLSPGVRSVDAVLALIEREPAVVSLRVVHAFDDPIGRALNDLVRVEL